MGIFRRCDECGEEMQEGIVDGRYSGSMSNEKSFQVRVDPSCDMCIECFAIGVTPDVRKTE